MASPSPRRYRMKDAQPMADGGFSSNANIQDLDESFNKNARDTSTDLGDISGTNSRRAMEYLQEGQGLENQAGETAQQYGSDYAAARDAGDQAAEDIRSTDYSQYRTDPNSLNQRYLTSQEQSSIAGDPNQPERYALGMGGAIYGQLGDSAGKAGTALDTERQQLDRGLNQERTDLGAAVDPSKLALSSDFRSKYEMTPEQQQDLVTAAGTTVGNRYRSAVSDLNRAAAADGNTSPIALAAMRKQLEDDSAAQAGDAMTQARIDASNAAAGREQTLEGMRLGTQQDISSRLQQNATTLGGQQQQATETTGEQGLTEAERERQAGLQGIETGGQAAIAAGEYGDTSASQRAAELAGNRQQTTADVQNTQYQQGVQTGQLNQGAKQSYVDYKSGQQGRGEQGQLTSQGQQIGAYGTKTGAANQAEGIATEATAATRGQGIGDKATSAFGNFISNLEDGGIAGDLSADDPMAQPNDPSAYADGVNGGMYGSPKPGLGTKLRNDLTDAMGSYRSGGSGGLRSYARGKVLDAVGLANGATYVGKPTLALIGEHAPEMVVPLDRTASTKVPPSTLRTAAAGLGRYRGMRPGGPHGPNRPMTPLAGSLAAR